VVLKRVSEANTFSDTMPQYQLPIAGVLAASTLASLVVFFLTRTPEGKVQLPIRVQDGDLVPAHDAFDVTKPEDIVDGYPIDEDKFWTRVC
jgi:hypothetical protein